jgi:cytosine/uracil/thiamine/allantoin permease
MKVTTRVIAGMICFTAFFGVAIGGTVYFALSLVRPRTMPAAAKARA